MLLFDIETNGLLPEVSTLHCIATYDTQTSEARIYSSLAGDLEIGIRSIMDAPLIGGHNVIKYDIPVLQKLYPHTFKIDPAKVFDTLIAARLIWTNIKDTDAGLLRQGKLPGKRFGSFALEAFGYRLGEMKGEYSGGWETVNQDMIDYCIQDVQVTTKLWEKIKSKNYPKTALTLEHEVAWLIAQQERNGFCFDEAAAVTLFTKLLKRQSELQLELETFFGSWESPLPDFIPKRNNKTKGFIAGVPVKRSQTIVFNPQSRLHIADRLMVLYGWIPTEFTDGGSVKVDETVIGSLTYPPCPILNEYLTVEKRLSQLANGKQAWMRVVNKGKIHGSVTTNGAVTGRATHSYPNISQVPNSGSPYGSECRSLFTVPEGWFLVGSDQSGLELRCLAHFLARLDGGQYAEAVVNGDVHTLNQHAAGLATRSEAKTFIYAWLYGGGDELVGNIVGGGDKEGRKIKSRFLKANPSIKELRNAVVFKAENEKKLIGLDGRTIHIRAAFSSLNALLQGAGAVLCKKWIVLVERELSKTLKHGWDGDYVLCAWSHDETQHGCRTLEIAEYVAKVCCEQAVQAGLAFNFRCATAGEAKIGKNWSETH